MKDFEAVPRSDPEIYEVREKFENTYRPYTGPIPFVRKGVVTVEVKGTWYPENRTNLDVPTHDH